MVRSHLGSKFFAASSRQSHHNRTAMFQAIVPYEDEFSPTNPPHDILLLNWSGRRLGGVPDGGRSMAAGLGGMQEGV